MKKEQLSKPLMKEQLMKPLMKEQLSKPPSTSSSPFKIPLLDENKDESTPCSSPVVRPNPMSRKRRASTPLKPILTPAKKRKPYTPQDKSIVLRKLREAGLAKSDEKSTPQQLNKRLKHLETIVCFDDDIIQSSSKPTLSKYLNTLGLVTKNKSKAELQLTLHNYLDARARNCNLPATLLKKGSFWQISVKKTRVSVAPLSILTPLADSTDASYSVCIKFGKLGRKRAERSTPMKIIPTPTKTKFWSKEFPSRDAAVADAKARIIAKRSEGYYISTEGDIAVEAKENNAPVIVRSDSERSLKFAPALRIREFHKQKAVQKFVDLNTSVPTNFESDNED